MKSSFVFVALFSLSLTSLVFGQEVPESQELPEVTQKESFQKLGETFHPDFSVGRFSVAGTGLKPQLNENINDVGRVIRTSPIMISQQQIPNSHLNQDQFNMDKQIQFFGPTIKIAIGKIKKQ